MKTLLTSLLVALGVFVTSTAPAKPNLLILYADDLGYGDVQCYNPDRGRIPTPNIDKLAAEGMRFTDGHSSSGVCSPSRYTLLTGRYHWRSKLQGGIVDLYFGTDVPNWPPYCFIENDRTVGIPSEFLPARLIGNNQASNQGPALADWTLEPILPALGDRAAAFIREAAAGDEPFLLYLPLTSPHTPLSVNEEWKGKSGLNLYADFVKETDAVIGRVLAALEQSGAAEDTLVVFTSDNGCAPYIGKPDLEKMGHYPSGPLRGAKADAWEGGHRVPFVVRWPGVVEPGSVCDQLVHQADLLRTFADALGTTLPENAGEDSVSLLPLLKGGTDPVREYAVSASISGVPALRQGSWKYIAAPGSGGWGEGGDQSQPVQLYNLANDLGETKNLAAAQPEKLAGMQALLERLIVEGRSTPGARQNNDQRVNRYPVTVEAKGKGD